MPYLLETKKYIFPHNSVSTIIFPFIQEAHVILQKKVETTRPYENPLFIDILTACFFDGSDSIAAEFPERFEVEFQDRVTQCVPIAMVCLVATAVSASSCIALFKALIVP